MSYGTFSCTLEGFDDSFDTMKAIAEYFRDLASDDRYFGAEPPTPDAEMLARIAEREAARRVETRSDASGIVLRAAQALPPVTAEAAPQPAPRPAPAAPPAPETRQEAAPQPVPAAKPVPTAQPDPVSQDDPAPQPEPAAPRAAGTAPAQPRPAPDGDSVAAKLQRIRAVVGRQPSLATEDEEEDIAPAPQQGAAGMFDTAPARSSRADTPQPAAEAAPASPVDGEPDAPASEARAQQPRARVVRMRKADFDRAVARGSAHQALSEAPEAEAAHTDTDTDTAARQDTETRAKARTEAEAASVEAREMAEAQPAPHARAQAETPAEDRAEVLVDTGAEAPEPQGEAGLPDDAERALLAELAALEREMGLERDGPASVEMTDTGPDRAAAPDTNEDTNEDAIAAAVSALTGDEQEHVDPIARPKHHSEHDTPAAEDDAGQPAAHRTLETDEADMSRIMSATDARMADPESGRRRESISQLKAAVAATEAARQLGEVDQPAKVEEAFRDDLRQAVRPRRPARPGQDAAETADARPERPRPAPLKLVAAQRVDVTETAPQERPAPVRPRRVSVAETVAAEPAPQPSESFTAFAARMGAQELSELLEAAAAYTAFVEGAEDFSRPQLMERVREASPDPISREDGLRSFGTLLRQGALTRVRSGRFSVAQSSRFNPERRAG
ncbi:CPN protein [Limimaricola hongkongensis DSM 17492]|uniref:CPN protein n=1 Tax=Limimaricola hongkongensis DSM 17492 TaxID=1122180 RepID=A0A017HDZ0_9RHOB|nr:CPN protein [Limimaricola hongkongensis DSM 17492]